MAVTTTPSPKLISGARPSVASGGIGGLLGKLREQQDVALPLGIIGVIAMLILPMPEWMLDFCLLVNISGAVLILLTAIYANEPLEFSIFPSLLLVTTLYRLSLEISAMKLILGNNGQAGAVINAFGQVVLGGNYVVGLIVFAILVVVQFVVITAGAGRVAEVAARFTLDAMPGKQMAIDADLNAGIITQEQAKARRKSVEREADFYGAMDGASKFVRGDAIAAVVIIALNIVGGFAMGMVSGKGDILTTLKTYTLVTVGEGLVAQIPALLISTASGLMVTRAAGEGGMSRDLVRQVFGSPRALIIAAALLLCFIPLGFPPLQTLGLSAALGGSAYGMMRARKRAEEAADAAQATQAAAPKAPASTPESVMPLLAVDTLELEIGYGLMPLVDSGSGGDLLDRITMIRRQTATELGLIIPSVRIRDNLQLKSNDYQFKLKNAVIGKGTVMPNSLMIMDPGTVTDPITDVGTAAKEPAFGLPAHWIPQRLRERAEIAGYTVVEPSAVMATHITEMVKAHAWEVLSRQDTQSLIDNLKKSSAAVVDELIPNMMTIGEVQKVLQLLLKERISIRDLVTILETLADNAGRTKDSDTLAELVRIAMARSICKQFAQENLLQCITLDPQLEQELQEKVQPGLNQLIVDPSRSRALQKAIASQADRMAALGHTPLLLSMQPLRLPLRRLTERSLPQLVLLSYNEIIPEVEVRAFGNVSLPAL